MAQHSGLCPGSMFPISYQSSGNIARAAFLVYTALVITELDPLRLVQWLSKVFYIFFYIFYVVAIIFYCLKCQQGFIP